MTKLTGEKLQRELIIKFLEIFARIDNKKAKLYDYQKKFLRDTSVFRIVNKARQLGFSFILAAEGIVETMLEPSTRDLYISSSEDAAKRILAYCKQIYYSLPTQIRPPLYRNSSTEMQFRDVKTNKPGGLLVSLPNNPRTVRGFNATRVGIDEFAHFRDDEELLRAIQPSISRGGKLTIISTPNGRANKFYDIWDTDVYYTKHVIPYTRCPDKTYQKRIEQMRLTMDAISFAQEYECFPKGTDVIALNDIKDISDIVSGDFVLSHSGRFRKVKHTFSREYSGDVFTIKSYGNNMDIVCTPEHPVRICNDGVTHQWKKAKDLTKSDSVVFPKMLLGKNTLISSDLAELIGWFIAEGSYWNKTITFALGSHEKKYIQNVKKLLERFSSNKVTIRTKDGATTVNTNDCGLGEFFISQCGCGAINKRVPIKLIKGNEDIVFEALMSGDGCYWNTKWGEKGAYRTISKTLAYQVQLLAHSLGYSGSISEKKIAGKGQILGRYVMQNDAYEVRIKKQFGKRSPKIKRHKYNISAKIMSVEKKHYEGTVYNLEVDIDSSYTANGRSVHNCKFLEDTLAFFPDSLISPCIDNRLGQSFELHPKGSVFMGIDWAKKYDSTAVIVGEMRSDPMHLTIKRVETYTKIPYQAQLEHIYLICRELEVEKIFCDSTGVGEKLYEDLVNKSGASVDGITFSLPQKELLITNLRILFESEFITIPRHDMLISQLRSLERSYTPTGNVRFKHVGNAHDDLAWALALCAYECRGQDTELTYKYGGEREAHTLFEEEEHESMAQTRRLF